MPHRRSPPLPLLGVGRLGLGDALVEDLGVLVLCRMLADVFMQRHRELTAASLEASA
jgi:hypothetical protein